MEKKIENNPSLKKLKDDAKNFKALRDSWPILRPFLKLFGAKVDNIDKELSKVEGLVKETERLVSLPDRFNDRFSEQGWILLDNMDVSSAEEAIKIYDDKGLIDAEEYLVNYFSPEWVTNHFFYLKHIAGFRDRYDLTTLALNDYKEGRYYASILVVLTTIDGLINEVNIINNQRVGFFSYEGSFIAWDSIVLNEKGLQKIKNIMTESRQKTRVEKITIPYRHGILHGMDLGYNNQIVAAKCWMTLFAVRDWLIKKRDGQLHEPIEKQETQKSLIDLISIYKKIEDEQRYMKTWKPRDIAVPRDVPEFGESNQYKDSSPEKVLIEFANLWMVRNYGYMAKQFSIMLDQKPADVRQQYGDKTLKFFKILKINDVSASVTDIEAEVVLETKAKTDTLIWIYRLIYTDKNGNFSLFGYEDGAWGITSYRNK
jgi:hypothetical protein